jgi:hypothetical protein
MDKNVGLYVSMEETSVCILDGAGNVVYEGKAFSQPDALAKLLSSKVRDAIWLAPGFVYSATIRMRTARQSR